MGWFSSFYKLFSTPLAGEHTTSIKLLSNSSAMIVGIVKALIFGISNYQACIAFTQPESIAIFVERFDAKLLAVDRCALGGILQLVLLEKECKSGFKGSAEICMAYELRKPIINYSYGDEIFG